MRRASNHSTLIDPSGVLERDGYTCNHCQRIVHVQPRQRPEDLGGLCKVCMNLLCPHCYALRMKGAVCKTWEKQMDEMEARDRFHRQFDVLTR